ncbi:MAG: hypothetical protein JST86_14075 [Bacteroidetes bacterium]|nr:hypothetical protein [Bacteroidota bacterium]
MKMYKLILFTMILLRGFTNVYGQQHNSYLFIEPNISIAYDSTVFTIAHRYSNTFYETESYDFALVGDSLHRVSIHVEAAHPVPVADQVSLPDQERAMNAGLKDVKNEAAASKINLVEYDSMVQHIGAFLCVGTRAYDPEKKDSAATIVCFHATPSDNTQVQLIGLQAKSLKDSYAILRQFLQGFTAYSKAAIDKEDSLIKARYSIQVVAATDTVENLRWRNNDYLAVVKTNEPLLHRFKEVRLDMESGGKEIFAAGTTGTVYVASHSNQKGMIERKGEFIVLNSFGKMVKIPFSFRYENK